MAQDEITATFSVGGMPSVSTPPQPQRVAEDSSAVSDNDQFDYGLNESKEVGHDGSVQCYGIDYTGPAGGGIKRNTKD